ncbi:hypothetical protein FA95DRAFT_1586473 [Auriscalpium vulgare]|uniref:Uncharacterized protein n=1 Tax=Auriscalpium vulgare TaxID=40419 RepID=A0ACB8S9P2_9AGAM|nr:hypothetical protein FA95DRAFT_1586473 [Auriscalpium vulgare]
MLALKSEPAPAEEGLLASFDPASIQAELDIWEHLNFSFDMDKDQHNPRQGASSSGRGGASNRARSSSTPGAGGIPPAGSSRSAASASGAPPAGWIPPNAPFPPPTSPENYEALARALRTVQEAYPYFPAQSGGYPPPQGLPAQRYPPQLPPEQYSQFPWPPAPPQSQAQSASQFNTPFPPFPYSQGGQYGGSPPPHTTQLSHLNAQLQPLTTGSPASASGSPSSGQGQDMSPVDELTMSEEKRRRNTAASGASCE